MAVNYCWLSSILHVICGVIMTRHTENEEIKGPSWNLKLSATKSTHGTFRRSPDTEIHTEI